MSGLLILRKDGQFEINLSEQTPMTIRLTN